MTMNSTTIAAAIFLPCAPVAMLICHWRSKRTAARKQARRIAADVEYWLIVRGRG